MVCGISGINSCIKRQQWFSSHADVYCKMQYFVYTKHTHANYLAKMSKNQTPLAKLKNFSTGAIFAICFVSEGAGIANEKHWSKQWSFVLDT